MGAQSEDNMEARAEHQKVKNYNVLYVVDTVLGAGAVLLIFVWILQFRSGFGWQSKPHLEFNWHPLLMVLSLVFLYAQSMLVYRTGRAKQKKTLKLLHAALHFLAFVFAVIGLKAVFDSHNLADPPIPNLYTLHSWIGLITVILFTGQFVFGFVTFLYPGLSQSLRSAFLPVHVHLGAAIFCMAFATALLGIAEKTIWAVPNYAILPPEGVLTNVIGVVVLCYGVLSLYLVNDATYKRTTLPEETMTLADNEEHHEPADHQ